MTLSVSTIGDNPQQPGIFAETYIPDQLIAGALKLVSQPIVLAAGTLQRGTVLGQQTTSSVEAVTGATNTGNGTIGLTSQGSTPTYGAFVLTAKSATDFGVVDPEGNVLADATVGTAYAGAEINFKITAGGTAFVAGDKFTLNVIEATGNYIESIKTASDGSQNPTCILADYADASGGPVTTGAYVLGEFNANAITFDASWTLPVLRATLQPLGLFLKSSVSAADPIPA